jgi:hypothetical protein
VPQHVGLRQTPSYHQKTIGFGVRHVQNHWAWVENVGFCQKSDPKKWMADLP